MTTPPDRPMYLWHPSYAIPSFPACLSGPHMIPSPLHTSTPMATQLNLPSTPAPAPAPATASSTPFTPCAPAPPIPSESPWKSAVRVLRPYDFAHPSILHDILPGSLNANFDFINSYRSLDLLIQDNPFCDERFTIVQTSLYGLLTEFKHFTTAHLVRLLASLGINIGKDPSKERAARRLIACQDSDPSLLFLFKSLPRSRTGRASGITVFDYTASADTKKRTRIGVPSDFNLYGKRPCPAAPDSQISDLARASPTSPPNSVPYPNLPFPEICPSDLKDQIIADFQAHVHPSNWKLQACAVCRGARYPGEIQRLAPSVIDFTILQNPGIPDSLMPTEYDLDVYQHAILYPPGMYSLHSLGDINVCSACSRALTSTPPRLPEFALANWYYYAWERLPPDVRKAFENASDFDKMLVAKCWASRITHRFCENRHYGPKFRGDPATTQSYTRGNTIILPQDPSGLRSVLPPNADDIKTAMCVLFVGNTEPTEANIKKLAPVLCNKPLVSTIIHFLLEKNPYYKGSTSFSQSNLDDLFAPMDAGLDSAIPRAVEIACIPFDEGTRAATSDYTDRNDGLCPPPNSQDILIEAVGYTDGDRTPQNYREMKAKALTHFRTGHAYLKVRHGSQPVSDRDEAFLTWLSPHLDPWGIGALNNPRRTHKSSLLRQVQHLLRLHNSPFAADPNFAYVCMNIIMRAEVNKSMSFRVSESQRADVVKQIMAFSPEALDAMRDKWIKNPYAKASNKKERSALRLLRSLRQVTTHLAGSAGHKTQLRNQIRGLMNVLGTPALFITLNPGDVQHPLVRILGGAESSSLEYLQRGEPVSKFERARFVAEHPEAAATFFDVMITGFIKHILRFGVGPGLFGTCNGYFGTVEAQGKGTLHLHLLIWLEGSLNPQALRDAMENVPGYRERVIAWLEDTISTELPGTSAVVADDKKKPDLPEGQPHPSAIYLPQIATTERSLFRAEFLAYVSELATHCNWHVHSDTCFKNLKGGEPRDDNHCRLGRDGKTRAETTIDASTGSILLRRLHPRINNFNDLVIFLMQCNVDFKFIGSGEAAKALTFYITDYITKAALPIHAGLSAISYAIRQNELKFVNDPEASSDARDKSLVTKSANAMMSRQETSHQQVMAHLIGGGDHYTSHEFRNLRWGAFDRYVRSFFEARDECDLEFQDTAKKDPDVLLRLKAESVAVSDQVQDYTSRPRQEHFDNLALWDFVACTEKISATGDADIEARLEETDVRRGPKPLPRGYFSNTEHAQYETHKLRFRRSAFVPVLLGPTIPRRDKDVPSEEVWCRAMLILFKPWYRPTDLKQSGQSWTEAFAQYTFQPHLCEIIGNVNIQHQCRDAREAYSELRRSGKASEPLFSEFAVHIDNDDSDAAAALENALYEDDDLDSDSEDEDDELDEYDDDDDARSAKKPDANQCSPELMRLINILEKSNPSAIPEVPPSPSPFAEASEEDQASFKTYRSLLKQLKQNASPKTKTEEDENDRLSSAFPDVDPTVTIEQFGDVVVEHHQHVASLESSACKSPLDEIERIIVECGMNGNEEQERAFRCIAEHFVTGRPDQMLMYIGGVGGTGKSHVIRAIVKLFQRCGVTERLLLSAPTGIAAVLIEGYTIHSLTLLPTSASRPVDIAKLENIWRDVRWLVLDEVSMVSAKLMREISVHMSLARSEDPQMAARPFGGVNMVFSGDFGQLRPVNAKSLFSRDLVKKISLHTAQTEAGLTNLGGALLWRGLTHHVELLRNWRQDNDPTFAALLSRIRSGNATQHASLQGGDSDYKVLLMRCLEQLDSQPGVLETFRDAPFVVAKKNVRDPLNLYRVKQHAAKTGQKVDFFIASDFMSRRPVAADVQRRLLRLNSSITEDSLGKLPLVTGMPVMVTENIALGQRVVNGAEGTLLDVKYRTDDLGRKVALCAFVNIPGSNIRLDDGFGPDVVPILPSRTPFRYFSGDGKAFSISRQQLPLLPAYAYTDYKSQGRTLKMAILDLMGCVSLQSLYVMLSRVQSLSGLAVLRWFRPNILCQNLQQEFRTEFARLETLHQRTRAWFMSRPQVKEEDVDPEILASYRRTQKITEPAQNGLQELSTNDPSEPSESDDDLW